MNEHLTPAGGTADDTTGARAAATGTAKNVILSEQVFGAPCWVSLTSRDLEGTKAFYSAVLGWEWRQGKLGDRFRVATSNGVPVAGVGAVATMWQMAVTWTAYFAVPSADVAVSRAQERGGTIAVGPIAFRPGRAALLADRDGASFGIWEGELFGDWETWRASSPSYIRLHTRDAFDAAMFYGEVLEWATGRPGSCEVMYEGGEVVLRSRGEAVARIVSGALGAAPDPTIRPHWQVHFAVTDIAACVRDTQAAGGTVLRHGEDEALLRDPEGAQFTVTKRTVP